MSKILVILGSLNPIEKSASRTVANAFLDEYKVKNSASIIEMIDATDMGDLALTKNIIAGKIGAYEQSVIAQRDALLEKFKTADLIIIATPMFNFSLPAQVKEVLDTFVVAGETFKYLDKPDADGNVSIGLTEGKKVVLIQAMGGFNAGSKDATLSQINYMFDFIGVKDIYYIPVQATAIPGKEETQKRIIEAKKLTEKL